MKNTSKMTTNTSAAGNLYQARVGPNSNTETHNPDAQMSSNCFKKKRICCTMVNMPPSQLFWDLYQATNLKLAHFVLKMLNISQFKHLLCYLCFIVNKILAHVIRKYFSDHFIQIKKTATTFLEFGLQYHGILIAIRQPWCFVNTFLHTILQGVCKIHD